MRKGRPMKREEREFLERAIADAAYAVWELEAEAVLWATEQELTGWEFRVSLYIPLGGKTGVTADPPAFRRAVAVQLPLPIIF